MSQNWQDFITALQAESENRHHMSHREILAYNKILYEDSHLTHHSPEPSNPWYFWHKQRADGSHLWRFCPGFKVFLMLTLLYSPLRGKNNKIRNALLKAFYRLFNHISLNESKLLLSSNLPLFRKSCHFSSSLIHLGPLNSSNLKLVYSTCLP